MTHSVAIDQIPGFRRRVRISPSSGSATAMLEDDYHCMTVTLRHDGARISAVESAMLRWPWTTCPGARAVLESTFEGVLLDDVAARAGKKRNCTHLFDLAVLAAAHARDEAETVYDMRITDPSTEGEVRAELLRNGRVELRWSHVRDTMVVPPAVAGQSLYALRDWIGTLTRDEQEMARVLQWGCILAHGRLIPLSAQSDATRIPPNCFTFQPEQSARAVRIGEVIDFSAGQRGPLDGVTS